MAPIISSVVGFVVLAIVVWLIVVNVRCGKYNLIKVNKKGVPSKVTDEPVECDVEVNGINMHYAVLGEGDPLVLIHGNGGSHEELTGLMRYLANDFQVFAPDSRNHGKSGRTKELSYKLLTSDYNAFICALGLKKPMVVGFSDGGIIAIQLAMDYPNLLSGFVAFGANSRPGGIKAHFRTWAKWKYLKDRNPMYRIMIEEPDLTKEHLEKITTPAYIVAGEFDVIKLSDTAFLHKNIKSSRIAIVKSRGHDFCRRAPEIAYKIAREFFKTI